MRAPGRSTAWSGTTSPSRWAKAASAVANSGTNTASSTTAMPAPVTTAQPRRRRRAGDQLDARGRAAPTRPIPAATGHQAAPPAAASEPSAAAKTSDGQTTQPAARSVATAASAAASSQKATPHAPARTRRDGEQRDRDDAHAEPGGPAHEQGSGDRADGDQRHRRAARRCHVRQLHDHPAAARLARLGADRAAVGVDDPARDRQPEPGAAVARGARRVGAVEALEHPLGLGGRDAGPLVGDHDRGAAGGRGVGAQPHAALGRRVADRVVEQVGDHLVQPLGVAGGLQVAGLDAHLQPHRPVAEHALARGLLEQPAHAERHAA